MKTISLSIISLCSAIIVHAQNWQGKILFARHNNASTAEADFIYPINNSKQKRLLLLNLIPKNY